MNDKVFNEILDNYKEKYASLNEPDGRNEIFKWPAVRCCIDNWDIDAEDFLDMFKRSMRLTQTIIENRYKHPVNGIIYLCEQGKTEQVREEFRKLLSAVEDVRKRQDHAETFMTNINAMLEEIAPDKWSFEQDRRDPLMYQAFIQPDISYMFKSESARVFSNYVEFGGDIGGGQTFRLDNYYKLCDEVLAAVESDDEIREMLDEKLMEAAKANDMAEDDLLDMPGKLRIAVYDIMYCASSANLYQGMPKPVKKGSKEDKERARNRRIEEIQEQIEKESAELDSVLKDIPAWPDLAGLELTNLKYGKGKVTEQKDKYLYLDFVGTEKTFALPDCISSGFLTGADGDVMETCKTISDINKRVNRLTSSLKQLRSELSMLE